MEYIYDVVGASYVGNPKDNTAMYVTKKVEYLVENLNKVSHCIVFAENGVNVSKEIAEKNHFIFSDNPKKEYALFVDSFADEFEKKEKSQKYTLTSEGYYIGENVTLGKNVHIEPTCMIGHNVIIGDNALIKKGACIKHSQIGKNFIAGENCTIGTSGFTMAENDEGNKMKIPTLGSVEIGNNVEIGALTNISCGTAGKTIIENNVKVDSLCYIGHDAHIEKNSEIRAGVTIGGFCNIASRCLIGMSSSVRNRILIGENSIIGMGSIVTKSVEDNVTVVGNPARLFEKP